MKKNHILYILVFFAFAVESCKEKECGNKIELKNDIDSISYYSGFIAGWTLKVKEYNKFNPDIFYKAIMEVFYSKDFKMSSYEADYQIGVFFKRFHNKLAEKRLKESTEFLAKNKIRKGVVTTSTGLQYEIIKEGNGKKPKENDWVVLKYKGAIINGKIFINKYDTPDTTQLSEEKCRFPWYVLPGWIEALPLMKTGSVFKLYIPAELAYNKVPNLLPYVQDNMAVIFNMELLAVLPPGNWKR